MKTLFRNGKLLYFRQIRELQTQLTKERGSTAGSAQEIKESRSRIEALISKVSDLEGANLALNQKIADMAQEMEDQRSQHRAQLAAKDDEIKRLLDELSNQVKLKATFCRASRIYASRKARGKKFFL